jgi:hypothetical protein
MLSANKCPFLRTVVRIGDSKLLQFINLDCYALILSFSSLYEKIFSAKTYINPGKFLKLILYIWNIGEHFQI